MFASIMANVIPMRNLLSVLRKRFLVTSAVTLSSPTSPLPTSSSTPSFTVQLHDNSCGLPLKSALSVSKKFQMDEKKLQNSKSVLEFLKAHNFSDTQITQLIQKQPRLLQSRVESKLKPKFDFFIKHGLMGQIITELIMSKPFILTKPLDSQIKPCFGFLKSFLGCTGKIAVALKRSPWLLTYDVKGIMQPNTDLLIKEGVPFDRIAKLIMSQPRAIQHKHYRMVYAVNALKNLGIEPKTPMFIHALRVMLQMSESTWKKKVGMLKSLGWTEEEILKAFKQNPSILASSEEKIRGAMDFFVGTLRLKPQTVITNSRLLHCSIDKRLRPRYNVLKILKSKNLIDGDIKSAWLLTSRSEKKFLENYVTKYEDNVPGLLEAYKGISKAVKTDT